MISQAEFHPKVLSEDVPRLVQEFPHEQAYDEVVLSLRRALLLIARAPLIAGAECRYPPLLGWRKEKFHSVLKPPAGMRADMRIIFRPKPGGSSNEFQVRAIGKRRLRHPLDIYECANEDERDAGYP